MSSTPLWTGSYIEGHGACRVGSLANSLPGHFDEKWRVEIAECKRLCDSHRWCEAFEYGSATGYMRCELHRILPTHALPMPSYTCFVKDTPPARFCLKFCRWLGRTKESRLAEGRRDGRARRAAASGRAATGTGAGSHSADCTVSPYKDLRRCDFTGQSLYLANFEHGVADQLALVRADLTYAKLDYAQMRDADLTNATCRHATTSRTLGGEGGGVHGLLTQSSRYASLKSTNLKGATFDGADLTQALMEGATLTDASFVNATAGSAVLKGALAANANFARAMLNNAEMETLQAPGARFEYASLMYADFSKSNLRGATFVGTVFSFTSFKEADLTGTNWIRASGLETCDFTGAISAPYVLATVVLPPPPPPPEEPELPPGLFFQYAPPAPAAAAQTRPGYGPGGVRVVTRPPPPPYAYVYGGAPTTTAPAATPAATPAAAPAATPAAAPAASPAAYNYLYSAGSYPQFTGR
ncbi:hypothetical protein EMIHUDRAFT_448930 [Emiliania huxleyi CCMP1516]|uniref:Apple domain-containing protein n=2 Tax=Emiliania huxleyi TaxID=2903 RepID=A0A0D3KVC7_EMIH1|nr:hypothetical protein EMIHUDRAFT_448930 [Emiliania huxleyi CCMP1516]EOD39712.1 hypothetical protein EMIHUDRAFT_448930 [Emiliania huxleyi CCMP1516]|eukprot:XP_005792141.1 hypothetical protein EMIHUDRAFT_448930 [Emiliania huxleyi CCMP1516]